SRASFRVSKNAKSALVALVSHFIAGERTDCEELEPLAAIINDLIYLSRIKVKFVTY
ncbi:1684_t:CDS:1, partial [Ambispora leptoticha]